MKGQNRNRPSWRGKRGRKTDLISESIEIFNRIRLDNRMNRPNRSLQIRQDMIRKELDDVDESVGRSNSLLFVQLNRSARSSS